MRAEGGERLEARASGVRGHQGVGQSVEVAGSAAAAPTSSQAFDSGSAFIEVDIHKHVGVTDCIVEKTCSASFKEECSSRKLGLRRHRPD